MPLLRILGVAFGLAIVIGGSIGAGVLRTPGPVLAYAGTGPLAIATWIAGGIYALLGASALADLATSFPKSGGFYVYARRALGGPFGFAVGCADFFVNCAALPYAAVTAAEYGARLVPALAGRTTAAAAAVIASFAAVQLLGMRVNSRLQEATSFLKALGFFAVIAGIVVFTPAHEAEAIQASASPALPALVSLALALQLVLGAYDGWQGPAYFAGEDRDPARNLPRSLIGGVLLVMAAYVLMNLALLRALPAPVIAGSELPIAEAARLIAGEPGETAITLLALLSPLTLLSVVLLSGPRILYAMGADGLISPRTAYVDARGTPVVALLVLTVLGLAILLTGTFDSIATVFGFFALTSYAGGFISLLVLRRREPGLPRPFRSWGHPWTTLVVLLGSLGLLAAMVAGAPQQSAIGVAAMLATYPVFHLIRVRASAHDAGDGARL